MPQKKNGEQGKKLFTTPLANMKGLFILIFMCILYEHKGYAQQNYIYYLDSLYNSTDTIFCKPIYNTPKQGYVQLVKFTFNKQISVFTNKMIDSIPTSIAADKIDTTNTYGYIKNEQPNIIFFYKSIQNVGTFLLENKISNERKYSYQRLNDSLLLFSDISCVKNTSDNALEYIIENEKDYYYLIKDTHKFKNYNLNKKYSNLLQIREHIVAINLDDLEHIFLIVSGLSNENPIKERTINVFLTQFFIYNNHKKSKELEKSVVNFLLQIQNEDSLLKNIENMLIDKNLDMLNKFSLSKNIIFYAELSKKNDLKGKIIDILNRNKILINMPFHF